MATRVGRLVVADFRDPERLARLAVARFRRYAAMIRAAGYGGAVGDPARWETASQV